MILSGAWQFDIQIIWYGWHGGFSGKRYALDSLQLNPLCPEFRQVQLLNKFIAGPPLIKKIQARDCSFWLQMLAGCFCCFDQSWLVLVQFGRFIVSWQEYPALTSKYQLKPKFSKSFLVGILHLFSICIVYYQSRGWGPWLGAFTCSPTGFLQGWVFWNLHLGSRTPPPSVGTVAPRGLPASQTHRGRDDRAAWMHRRILSVVWN